MLINRKITLFYSKKIRLKRKKATFTNAASKTNKKNGKQTKN